MVHCGRNSPGTKSMTMKRKQKKTLKKLKRFFGKNAKHLPGAERLIFKVLIILRSKRMRKIIISFAFKILKYLISLFHSDSRPGSFSNFDLNADRYVNFSIPKSSTFTAS